MRKYKLLSTQCVQCGNIARVYKATGLCSSCVVDNKCPTREEIDEECRKIRAKGFNQKKTGLGDPEGEHRSVKIYRTPTRFGG